ncbi:MAG: citrate/2-methylcitrate synthase [Actinomycetota bacterium]
MNLIAPPGLKGLVVADTEIGSVRGDEGFFHYRNRNAVDVARHSTFEAAVSLLLDGALPDAAAESAMRSELAAARAIDATQIEALVTVFERCDTPLAALRAAYALLIDDTPSLDLAAPERRARVIRAIGVTPTVLAAFHRTTEGLPILAADPGLGHAADYVRLVTGATPAPRLARAVETYLLLTADHGFNASTFTARVITSTGAGLSSVYCGAVGALSGPLHGGAPSRVLDMIHAIGNPANTESWARAELEAGNKLMGFGHAVYRADDPRSLLLREIAIGLGGDLVAQAQEIEERMLRFLAAWKPEATIVTNVEFYAAVVLHLAGLSQDMFTPTFTTSRVVGWGAHALEQAANNKIMRPAARYVGPEIETASSVA